MITPKYLLLVLVFSTVLYSAKAQFWIPRLPTDSSKWHIQVNRLDSTTAYYLYSLKGDTLVNNQTYLKVYRQVQSDSALFNPTFDSLRFFIRQDSIDSNLVVMRFADSINPWGTQEFELANFKYGLTGPTDTLKRALLIDNKKVWQTVVVNQFAGFWPRCDYDIPNSQYGGVYSLSPSYMITELDSTVTLSGNWQFQDKMGEKDFAWFSIDFDSLAKINLHLNNKKVMNFYKFETYLYDERTKQHFWATINPQCLVSVPQINAPTVEFKIYPNPAQTLLNVELENFTSARFNIYDIMGNKVLNGQLNLKPIEIKHLPKGEYFIQVLSRNQLLVRKFIKL